MPHKRYLNDYLTGVFPGSRARGELYNDDPRLGDARLCGTTASLCGIETARKEGGEKAMTDAIRLDGMLHALMFTLSGIPVIYSGDEIARENDYTYHKDPLKAEDQLRKADKQRASYYNYYATGNWGDVNNYDLCVDTGTLGIPGAVDLIAYCAELREKNVGRKTEEAW